jgi:hypothetical protein
VSAFANCGRAIAHVRVSYVPNSRHGGSIPTSGKSGREIRRAV